MRNVRTIVASVLLGAVAVTACGSSSGSASAKPYVDAMMQSKNSNDLVKNLGEKDARCLATNMIDAIGVDTLEKAGVTPAQLADGKLDNVLKGKITQEKAEKVVDAMFNGKCVDIGKVMANQIGKSSLGGLDSKQANCIFEKMLELPGFKKAIATGLRTGEDPDMDKVLGGSSEVFSLFGKCGISPSDLAG